MYRIFCERSIICLSNAIDTRLNVANAYRSLWRLLDDSVDVYALALDACVYRAFQSAVRRCFHPLAFIIHVNHFCTYNAPTLQ